jgi:segregation and condensation protein B
LENLSIDALLEALLFVADGPVSLDDLARALDVTPETLEEAVQRLIATGAQRGLRVAHVGRRLQMVTAPEAAPVIERFLGLANTGKLSAAALEALAIVAYRQPITRAQIEAIRGVNSDGVLRTLLARGLIAPVGRLEQAGRPVLYGTTFEFLQYFGIQSLDELPSLPELEDLAGEMKDLPQS